MSKTPKNKIENWIDRFDEGCNANNISDPPSDKEWIKDFIQKQKELSKQEAYKEILEIVEKYYSSLIDIKAFKKIIKI